MVAIYALQYITSSLYKCLLLSQMELSRYLRQHARTIAGKSQLFINSYAKALEVIPRQLCDNAGFDATDVLNKLRQKHAISSGLKSYFHASFSCSLPVLCILFVG